MAEGHDSSIEDKLRQAHREERKWYNIRGASRLILWLIALLAVDFLIDWGLFAKTQMLCSSAKFVMKKQQFPSPEQPAPVIWL